MVKKIIGLDTSTNCTGVGIITIDGNQMNVRSSSINLRNMGRFKDEKLEKMILEINNVIEEERPDVIVIEDNCVENSPADKNRFQSRKLSNLVGSCMAIGYIKGIKVVLYNAPQWRLLARDTAKQWCQKREFCKNWSVDRVKELFNVTVNNDDESDAILLAYAYLQEMKGE